MIELIGINKSYGSNVILKDVSLKLYLGELTFITGASGSGKSTLLNLIGGLDKADSGDIIVDGNNIASDLDSYRANQVGFIFQDFNLIHGLSVKENIELALAYCHKEAEDREISDQISALGIKDERQRVETLSGGERQRAAIARSICKDCGIIIADEPTGNLDSENAEIVLSLLERMKENRYIVIVTHDLEKAGRYADRIIELKDGRICSDSGSGRADNFHVSSDKERNHLPRKMKKQGRKRPVRLLGLNSLKLRKGKIISISLVIALAISTLAMVINFNQSGSQVAKNVNVNYLESDLINLYYPSRLNSSFREYPFSTEAIEHVTETYDVKEMVRIYQSESISWLFSAGNKAVNANVKQINIDEFFEDRVMSNEVEGAFPQDKSEIILAEDVASQLFDGDCIGKTVALNDALGHSLELKIVGINHTVNPFDEIYSFVSADVIGDIRSEIISETISKGIIIYEFQEEVQELKVGSIRGPGDMYSGEEDIIVGKFPEDASDIILSSEQVKQTFRIAELSDEIVEELMETRYVISLNGEFEVHVCGIYESESIGVRYSEELIREMKEMRPVRLDIYLSDSKEVTSIKNFIIDNEEFTAETQLEYLKGNVSQQTSFFRLALSAVGIILILISVAMLHSFSKLAVLERKREIAIIKSLGADNGSVMCTLLFDTAIISLTSICIALIISAIATYAMPYAMPDLSFIYYGYPFALILCIGAVFAVMITLYTAFTIRKIVRKMPAELFVQQS